MFKEYFNKVECTKLINLIEVDPFSAKIGFEKYLENYPYDYYARCVYASVLIVLRDFESAQSVLDDVDLNLKKNNHFSASLEKKNLKQKDLFFSVVKLYSYMDRYEELYEYILKHVSLSKECRIFNMMVLYCQKNLGLLEIKRQNARSYLHRQIIEYQKSDMLEHIKDHLADYNATMTVPDSNVFVPDFPLDEVLKEIKKYMPSEKRLCYGLIDDTYIFKYDYCGKDNNRLTNYFKVICFKQSGDIITMCPVYGCDKLPYIDLNYIKKDDCEYSKVKVLSQKEKFYNRYKKNNNL